MQFFFRLLISITIIIICAQIGKRFPTLGGLIATMPLTGLIVLVWLYSENPGNRKLMVSFTKGALWGIAPSILFFCVAYFCFKKEFPLSLVLLLSFGCWLIGAVLHQWFLR